MPRNAIVVHVDDMHTRALPVMAYLNSLAGVRPNALFTTPLCYPHRAVMVTGQRGDHNGQQVNSPTFPPFGLEHTVQAWVHATGARTAYLGKPLHGYPWGRPPFVLPGVDFMRLGHDVSGGRYYEWLVYAADSADGAVYEVTDAGGEYSTFKITEWSIEFLEANANADKYLYVNYFAPHSPFIPAIEHSGLEPGDTDGPAFDADDALMAGRPDWLRNRPRLTADEITRLRKDRNNAYRTLYAVDEGIADLFAWLEANDQVDDTLFIFTSDNGFMFGDWRTSNAYGEARKKSPMAQSSRNPLAVVMPGAVPRTTTDVVVSTDLVATLVAWFGATPTKPLDGLDMTAWLRGTNTEPWRPHGGEAYYVGDAGTGVHRVPQWWLLLTPDGDRYTWYPTLTTGVTRERFNWVTDPEELVPLIGADPTLDAELHATLQKFRLDPLWWTRPPGDTRDTSGLLPPTRRMRMSG